MRTHIGNWLKALPSGQPAGSLAHRVRAAQRAALARRVRRRAWRQAGALAVAAGIVMAVALAMLMPVDAPEPGVDHRALEFEAAELEELLARFDANDRVLDMQTAGTIVRLEDRLAAIDYGLRNAALDERSRTRLMQQRVGLMQALAAVHMSSAPGLEF